MSDLQWRRGMERCQKLFERIASNYAPIIVCFIEKAKRDQKGADGPPGWHGRRVHFQSFEEPTGDGFRKVQIYAADSGTLEEFIVACNDAGHWLTTAAAVVGGVIISPQAVGATLEIDRWLYTLFDLAWNPAASGVRPSPRRVWARVGIQTKCYLLESLRESRGKAIESPWLEQIPDPPTCFYSIIENAAEASAAAADWLLHHPSSTMGSGGTSGGHTTNAKLPKKEANIKARDYLKQHFEMHGRRPTVAVLADAIGCSTGQVCKLPAWRAVMDEERKGRQPKRANVVNLTKRLEHAAGTRDESLRKLVAEQEADGEASPLQDDPPPRDEGAPRTAKVYGRK